MTRHSFVLSDVEGREKVAILSFWAYILRCADECFYTGHTDNQDRRFAQHLAGGLCAFTARRLPVQLAWSEEFPTRIEALEAERRIKSWSRAKKTALIDGDWAALSYFSKPPKERPSTSLGTNGVTRDQEAPFVSSEVETRALSSFGNAGGE